MIYQLAHLFETILLLGASVRLSEPFGVTSNRARKVSAGAWISAYKALWRSEWCLRVMQGTDPLQLCSVIWSAPRAAEVLLQPAGTGRLRFSGSRTHTRPDNFARDGGSGAAPLVSALGGAGPKAHVALAGRTC